MAEPRAYRAGETIEDFCRACKIDRLHAVVACDATGHPVRVVCSYCRSEHNYRGGPRMDVAGAQPAPRTVPARSQPAVTSAAALDIVSDRERTQPPMPLDSGSVDLEMLLRRVIREEAGISPVKPAEKWRGGHLVLRPGTPGLQEKSWPIET